MKLARPTIALNIPIPTPLSARIKPSRAFRSAHTPNRPRPRPRPRSHTPLTSSPSAAAAAAADRKMGYAANVVVVKSPTDKRLYRILHLPNGLCALLVHDPEIFPDGVPDPNPEEDEEDDDDEDDEEDDADEEDDEDDGEEECGGRKGAFPTKKAAAALCVGIGSFADPSEAQGLVHFLEHMLFMGSVEFPDENEYDSYLSKHGGSSNAYTETEHTCYYFEVNREYLKGALQRFCQFFISPLVKREAMEREVLAVDSEFNQALQNDTCRLQQLQCHTSSPDSPFNGFFWGNKKSLGDATENGVNLREKILRLYKENYFGGNMKLVVIGGEPLDILEEWVVDLFGNVKGGQEKTRGPEVKVMGENDMSIWKAGKVYKIQAVKDVHILELSWILPCLHKEYLEKPHDYLSHLLGHEGRGSLLFFLKARGWASSLSAGVGDEGLCRSSFAYIFVMTLHLTELGLEKVHEVIGAVYQYIKLLRQSAPQEWIFKELQDMGNLDFRFAEEQAADDYAVDLAGNLLLYPEAHIIYGDYVFEKWDDKLIERILGYFLPENMRIDILSKSFVKDSSDFQVEPWFGTQYIEEEISPSLLELWRDPPDVLPSLHLPIKNDFIPQNFSLCSSTVYENIDNPTCIIDQPMLKFWYKLDSTFRAPRANTYFLIYVKDGYSSARNCVLTELYGSLLQDELNDILYQAGVAKLGTSLSVSGSNIELKLFGFNDKLSTLLAKILTMSQAFVPKADRFMVIKEDMERALRNTNMKPLRHSSNLRLQVLRQNFWDAEDKLSCLQSTTLAELKDFIPQLLSQLHIEGLCHGNLSQEEVIHILDIFKTVFPAEPLPLELRPRECILCLPSGANLLRSVHVKNVSEVNSVVELYFQIEQDFGTESTRLRAITDLFSCIIEEPCFNQLRTKEQLGYVVESDPRMTYRVLGFCFRVQSSEYSPLHLHNSIDNFINGLQELLDGLDDETFNHHKKGLIEEKLEKDTSLSHETNRYWNQIVDKRYIFDVSKQEAEQLETIEKSDVVEWYNTYLRNSSPKCRRLAIHVWGCNTNMTQDSSLPSKFGKIIEDVSAFKLSSKFYPGLC